VVLVLHTTEVQLVATQYFLALLLAAVVAVAQVIVKLQLQAVQVVVVDSQAKQEQQVTSVDSHL
jgi:hypothetical protein